MAISRDKPEQPKRSRSLHKSPHTSGRDVGFIQMAKGRRKLSDEDVRLVLSDKSVQRKLTEIGEESRRFTEALAKVSEVGSSMVAMLTAVSDRHDRAFKSFKRSNGSIDYLAAAAYLYQQTNITQEQFLAMPAADAYVLIERTLESEELKKWDRANKETEQSRPVEKFGQRLYRLRNAQNMTQDDLARETEIERGSISKYENGKLIPHPEQIRALANALGVDLPYLSCTKVTQK